MENPHSIIYRFGRQIWIVPNEVVSTAFTAAYNKIISTKQGIPETLTAVELEAFAQVNDCADKYIIET
jgi:hypothetical protein